jgi:dienelactone hydrolase
MSQYAPEVCHMPLLRDAPKVLSFENAQHKGEEYNQWRDTVRGKLSELLGENPPAAPLNIRVESRVEGDGYDEIRFVYTVEANADVPCHLLLPKERTGPVPVVICLQGHTTGMHISLGRTKHEGDDKSIADGDRDFALQVVRQGWAALVMEQRCFGERCSMRYGEMRKGGEGCRHASLASLLLGRTMIGERVLDVSRGIDALAEFPELDLSRIGCMGNSGGGIITFYAACVDERISIAMPSCSFCALHTSIGTFDHCVDNYIPGILKYFDMGDLAALIAPRPFIVVAGRTDRIFPVKGVEEAYATVEKVYETAGAADQCRLIIGEGGHRFYAEPSWPVFRELAGW